MAWVYFKIKSFLILFKLWHRKFLWSDSFLVKLYVKIQYKMKNAYRLVGIVTSTLASTVLIEGLESGIWQIKFCEHYESLLLNF